MLRYPPSRSVKFLLFLSVAATWSAVGSGPARQGEQIEWRTGNAFQLQLHTPIPLLTWSEAPLRQSLTNLGRAQQVAIWLDRRVDPGQSMQLTVTNMTLDATLKQVAARLNARLGVSYVDSVAYLGPKSVTQKLATLAAVKEQETGKLPAAAKRRYQQRGAMQWKRLTTPRELLQRIAGEAGIHIVGIEQIPHDLWPERSLPELPLTDRLSLILAGFDLTFEVSPDGSAIRFVPLPESVAMTRSFVLRGGADRLAEQLSQEFPGVEFKRSGTRLVATGVHEDLDTIGRLLRGERVTRTAVRPDSTRFDLRVENVPVGAILKKVLTQRELTVKIDPAIEENLNRLVSVEVNQATLEQLLTAALTPAGIRYRIEGKQLELLPANR